MTPPHDDAQRSSDSSNRDPLAIAIGLSSIAVTVLMWVWWGGRLVERQEAMERRIATVEVWRETNTNTDAHQDTAIAVLDSKLTSIQVTLDSVAQKVGAKK